jgi:hypothetical protein
MKIAFAILIANHFFKRIGSMQKIKFCKQSSNSGKSKN